MTIRIALIEKSALVRAGLCQLLTDSGVEICHEGAFESLGTFPEVDIILVDPAQVPDQGLQRLVATARPARVVALAGEVTTDLLKRGIAAGLHGILTRDRSAETLVQSLRLIMLDERIFPSKAIAELIGRAHVPVVSLTRPLTGREQEVLTLLLDGNSNKMIARNLNLTEATVKVHVKALMRKLGVNNRTQIVIHAMRSDFSASQTPAEAA